MNSTQIFEQYDAYVATTYGRYPLALVDGKGAVCHDPEGKDYIDFSSGIGVNSLGFCDEAWAAAVAKQAATLNHVSNLYYSTPGGQLAETLCTASGMKKAFFANSGAESNEGAIKVNPHNVELTATGKAIKLLGVHSGGTLLYSDDYITVTKKDGITTVTAINSSCDDEKKISFNFGGKSVKAMAYVGKTLMPISDFEEEALDVKFDKDSSETVLAPISVALILFE